MMSLNYELANLYRTKIYPIKALNEKNEDNSFPQNECEILEIIQTKLNFIFIHNTTVSFSDEQIILLNKIDNLFGKQKNQIKYFDIFEPGNEQNFEVCPITQSTTFHFFKNKSKNSIYFTLLCNDLMDRMSEYVAIPRYQSTLNASKIILDDDIRGFFSFFLIQISTEIIKFRHMTRS